MKQLSPLERAVEYIEEHLNENIGLSDVSRETGYSYYHMTRLFSTVLGGIGWTLYQSAQAVQCLRKAYSFRPEDNRYRV